MSSVSYSLCAHHTVANARDVRHQLQVQMMTHLSLFKEQHTCTLRAQSQAQGGSCFVVVAFGTAQHSTTHGDSTADSQAGCTIC